MPRNEPQRSCIGCRETRDKKELLRFVLAPDRTLMPDPQAKLPGRGAYTCMSKSCLRTAIEKKQFARTFRGEVRHGGPDDLINWVISLMEERIGSYLALANKAGKVVSGSDMVEDALRKRIPGVVFIATDISRDIGLKIASLASREGVECFPLFDKQRLGALIGKELRSVVAVEESGFIVTIKQELAKYRNFVEGGAHAR